MGSVCDSSPFDTSYHTESSCISCDLASSFRSIHMFPKCPLQPLTVTTSKARKWKAGKGCLLRCVCFYSALGILLIIWRIRGALFLGKDWIQLYNGNLHLHQELTVEKKRHKICGQKCRMGRNEACISQMSEAGTTELRSSRNMEWTGKSLTRLPPNGNSQPGNITPEQVAGIF